MDLLVNHQQLLKTSHHLLWLPHKGSKCEQIRAAAQGCSQSHRCLGPGSDAQLSTYVTVQLRSPAGCPEVSTQ